MAYLYFAGPEIVALRQTATYQEVREAYGAISVFVVVFNVAGFGIALCRWGQLKFGKYTSAAIRHRWQTVLSQADESLN
jgi:hypothetical protein